MKPRGQVELIGLVVIVILITIAFLFLAQFALKEKPEKKIFTRKQLATSTLTAMMSTTVSSCQGSNTPLAVEEGLLDDCAENFEYDSFYHCGGQQALHSCLFLQDVLLPELLQKTLRMWNKRYEMESVLTTDSTRLIHLVSERGSCQGRERDTSGDFFLNTGAGLVRTVLYVCD